jgi:outer membrane lipoprotein carrier protein
MGNLKIMISVLAVAAVLVLLFPLSGGSVSADELAKKVQARYNGLKSISARFRQLSVNKVSMMKERSSGKVYISKPGRMRWEYEEPENRLIVSDGEKVWTYFPEQEQVYTARLDEGYISRTPLSFLGGKGNLEEDFEIVSSPVKDQREKLIFRMELKPRKPKMNLSRLVLEIDGESYLIVKSDLYDSLGNLISISFDNITIDPDTPEELFRFSPPENVEVIKVGE